MNTLGAYLMLPAPVTSQGELISSSSVFHAAPSHDSASLVGRKGLASGDIFDSLILRPTSHPHSTETNLILSSVSSTELLPLYQVCAK